MARRNCSVGAGGMATGLAAVKHGARLFNLAHNLLLALRRRVRPLGPAILWRMAHPPPSAERRKRLSL
jgi:hypothetical protein